MSAPTGHPAWCRGDHHDALSCFAPIGTVTTDGGAVTYEISLARYFTHEAGEVALDVSVEQDTTVHYLTSAEARRVAHRLVTAADLLDGTPATTLPGAVAGILAYLDEQWAGGDFDRQHV